MSRFVKAHQSDQLAVVLIDESSMDRDLPTPLDDNTSVNIQKENIKCNTSSTLRLSTYPVQREVSSSLPVSLDPKSVEV
ncbi:hypothetical protein Tco_1428134 [Tanacetum coccineum]